VEPFKNLLGPAIVRDAAHHLTRVWRRFDAERFAALALDGLEALEMKQRAMQISAALDAVLPARFAEAAAVIEASLGPPGAGDELGGLRTTEAGLAGWIVWPLSDYVARHGLDDPERGLATLHALTQRLSCEWAIRDFIEAHPGLTYATLHRWLGDPSAHVRRLVSEGSRPRLPWGRQLKSLIADPAPNLPLLRELQDDPSAYVRRSVANHLNDIAKDHPAIVAAWLEEHLPGAPAERQALLRHASRTLIKAGDARVLRAWGLGRRFAGSAQLVLTPKRIALGESLRLVATLDSTSRRKQKLVIDYAVHHVKADGSTSPKVFKGWTLELGAGETRRIEKTHPVRPITTRRYHPGRHEVDLRINGEAVARAIFDLRLPRSRVS
jgi:3-methyladenine DNA glycosylase AlkC